VAWATILSIGGCMGDAIDHDRAEGPFAFLEQNNDGESCEADGECTSGHCEDGVCCEPSTWYQDLDGDGWGNAGVSVTACAQPDGYVEYPGDCDDDDPFVYPGAPWLCDGVVNDCSGPLRREEQDWDGDGYVPCEIDPRGWHGSPGVYGGGDCNDEDPSIFPGATEICDGQDNNCSGVIDDCAEGHYCDANDDCVPYGELGEACDAGEGCASGHCVDGVCCEGPCADQCEACDVADYEGECVAVTGAPRGDRADCASDGSVCGGACDGTVRTACTYPSTESPCRSATCSDGVETEAASCDGQGACPPAVLRSCAPYTCGPLACAQSCASDGDCLEGHFCSDGLCLDLLVDGTACERDGACASGHCVDEVCCDAACTGQCEACHLEGNEGTCTAVEGSPQGERDACAGAGTICEGVCDGEMREACAYPAAETTCRQPSCSAGIATFGEVCDGAGACPAERTLDCAPYACDAVACAGDCDGDGDCAGDAFCGAGVCLEKLESGVICGRSAECASGFCVDGVCCESACEGQCEACDVAGSEGFCAPVTGSPHGGRPACAPGFLCADGVCEAVEVEPVEEEPDPDPEPEATGCSCAAAGRGPGDTPWLLFLLLVLGRLAHRAGMSAGKRSVA
jgi:hypothetical protein